MEQYSEAVQPPRTERPAEQVPINPLSGPFQFPMPSGQPLVDPSYAPVNDELSLEDQKRLIEPIFEELANCYNWACTALNAQQLYPFVSALSYNDILRSQRIGYYARVLRQMGYEMKMVGLMMKGVIKDTKNGHASPVIFQGVKSKKRYMEVIAGIYETVEPFERPLKTKPNSHEIDVEVFFPKHLQKDQMDKVKEALVPIQPQPLAVMNFPPLTTTTTTQFPENQNGPDDVMVQPGFTPIYPLPMYDTRAPQVTAPEVVASEVAAPEVAAPEVAAPEVVAPEVVAPEVVAPEVTPPEVVAPEEQLNGSTSALGSREEEYAKFLKTQRSSEEYAKEHGEDDEIQILQVIQKAPPAAPEVNVDVIKPTEETVVAPEVVVASESLESTAGMASPKNRFRIQRAPQKPQIDNYMNSTLQKQMTSSESLTSPGIQNPSVMSTGPTASEILTNSVIRNLQSQNQELQNSSPMTSGAQWIQNPNLQNPNCELMQNNPLLYAMLSQPLEPNSSMMQLSGMPTSDWYPMSSEAQPSGIPWNLNPNLQDLNLQNLNLQNLNLQDLNLQNLNLQDLNLQNLNLQNLNLQDLNLQNLNLQDLNLQNLNLQDPGLQNAQMPYQIPEHLSNQFAGIQEFALKVIEANKLGVQGIQMSPPGGPTSSGYQFQMPELVPQPGWNLRPPPAYEPRPMPGIPPSAMRGGRGGARGARGARGGARGARGAAPKRAPRKRKNSRTEVAIAPAPIRAEQLIPSPSSAVRTITLEASPECLPPKNQRPEGSSEFYNLPREAWKMLYEVLKPHYNYIETSFGFAEANRCTHKIPDGLLSHEWFERLTNPSETCLLKPRFAEDSEFRPVLEELLEVAKREVEGEQKLLDLLDLHPVIAGDPNLKVFVDAQNERKNKRKMESFPEREAEQRMIVIALDYLCDMSKTRPISCVDIIAFILWNAHRYLPLLPKFVFKTIRDTLKSFLYT